MPPNLVGSQQPCLRRKLGNVAALACFFIWHAAVAVAAFSSIVAARSANLPALAAAGATAAAEVRTRAIFCFVFTMAPNSGVNQGFAIIEEW